MNIIIHSRIPHIYIIGTLLVVYTPNICAACMYSIFISSTNNMAYEMRNDYAVFTQIHQSSIRICARVLLNSTSHVMFALAFYQPQAVKFHECVHMYYVYIYDGMLLYDTTTCHNHIIISPKLYMRMLIIF